MDEFIIKETIKKIINFDLSNKFLDLFKINRCLNIDNLFNNKNENLLMNINYKKIKDLNTFHNIKKYKLKVIKRFSRYRGVCKNRKKWQVYIMINKKNTYLGSYRSEKMAAKIYDLFAIKKNGINAKTNFRYNNILINKITKLNINIYDLIKLVSKMYI